MNPTYRANAVDNPEAHFEHFWNNLPWEQRDAPRRECYFNEANRTYTYGKGQGVRSYEPVFPMSAWDEKVLAIKLAAEAEFGCTFEACFINGYVNEREHLHYHSDDSPIIDPTRPILVYSFGAERELWYRMINDDRIEKVKLGSGSLFVMPAGMQQTHEHRIPKHSAQCGPRVSLTFRGLMPE